MSAAEGGGAAIADRELSIFFSEFSDFSRVILAVSGGPDSTALLSLAARWRAARKNGPVFVAATIDHRLRPAAKKEAAAATGINYIDLCLRIIDLSRARRERAGR